VGLTKTSLAVRFDYHFMGYLFKSASNVCMNVVLISLKRFSISIEAYGNEFFR
jgi:hypothetical protein